MKYEAIDEHRRQFSVRKICSALGVKESNYYRWRSVQEENGSGTGLLKKAEVTARIYAALPSVLRLIISERVISKLIETGLEYAKEVWRSDEAINNYISTGEDVKTT